MLVVQTPTCTEGITTDRVKKEWEKLKRSGQSTLVRTGQLSQTPQSQEINSEKRLGADESNISETGRRRQERPPTADADTADSCLCRQHEAESPDSVRGVSQLPANDRNYWQTPPQNPDSDVCLQLHDKHPKQPILMRNIPQPQSIVSFENDQRGQKTDSDGN